MRLVSLVVMLAFLALPAGAEDDPRVESARIAVNLFGKTCLSHMAETARIVDIAAGELNMAEMPAEMAAPFLLGRDGRAFSAATGGSGFVIALPADGLCLVYAQSADPVEIGTRFRAVMDQATADTFKLVPSGESQIDGRISRSWELVPTGSHLKALKAKFGAKRDYPALFEVGLTTAPAGGLFEAVLTTGAKVVPKAARKP